MLRHLVRLIFNLIRFALRLIVMIGSLMITSLSTLFLGVPQAVERLTDSWIEHATESGFSLGYSQETRAGVRVVAYVSIILGWVVIGSLAVYIIRLLISSW